ncbi:MAG: sigma-54 dependent transcriptional regulator, partial [Pseudomonadota bacterium]|nr:sigma-54 dependent transcriptional regulator [Pseudomonadota bacterium]
LIIGSLQGHATIAAHIAIKKGAKVTQVLTLDEGLNALRAGKGADLVLVDVLLNVPHFIRAIESERICTPVVACGVNANPKLAGEAIEAGAKEYLPLPPDPELIAAVISAVAEVKSAFIFNDPSMKSLLALADKIAPSEASVFLTGESGTGKEVMAKYIHLHSKRAEKAFVTINCAAIPENLLESELFGHEKGAFTGAIARRIGKFEEASGGTLLLDEISEMHPRLQAKLLRAIQERVIDRVGGVQPVSVDIRILATSNRDMLDAINKGEFREDLYFRLNVVNLHIPQLKARQLDIIPLAEHFIAKYCGQNHLPLKKMSERSQDLMTKHSWRGNVRELENVMHRAVLLSQDIIEPEDIFGPNLENLDAAEFANGAANANSSNDINNNASGDSGSQIYIGRTVADMERDLIIGTLDHCLGNRTHAATILGISIRTLRNKLKEYNESINESRGFSSNQQLQHKVPEQQAV